MRIPFTLPRLGAPEVRAVVRAMRRGQIGGNGELCRQVQDELAAKIGAAHALLTPSATSAMEVFLHAADIRPGDEVLMPSFAYVSQANSLITRGAVPVFCEIDPATLNIDASDAAARVTEKTKLILAVHYAGIACDMDALGALAKERGLLLFEDAAQAIGATWRGEQLGTIGDAGMLSFHSTKNVTCGEGGALLTNDAALAEKAEIAHEKGTNRTAFLRGEVDKYTWVGPGSSYVMSDLLAALLSAQLARMDEINAHRRWVWERFHDGLEGLEADGALTRPTVPEGAAHNGHAYVLRVADLSRQQALLQGLKKRGVQATFHFQPLHASPYAMEHLGTDPTALPHTLEAAETLVRLPLHDRMRRRHVDHVLRGVRDVLAAG